jgi:hypothetical protein
MTKQILTIILLAAGVGLTVGLTGCSNVVTTTSAITTPTQPLPAPGSPTTSKETCPPNVPCYSVVRFPTACVLSNGNNYVTVTLTNATNGKSEVTLTSKYGLASADISTIPIIYNCASPCTSATNNTHMCFVATGNHKYVFNVFFTYPTSTSYSGAFLTITTNKPTTP